MPEETHVELIVFVDASEEAFASVAYFRFRSDDGQVHVAQVMAKAKVAPVKQLTIPQLELQSAVLGVRMANTIKELHSFKIASTKFLTDSTCVLHWINSTTYKFKTFVAARILEILETTKKEDWFHVGTADNVADDATRAKDFDVGDNEARWYRGPAFLMAPEEEWPIKQLNEVGSDVMRATVMMIKPTTKEASAEEFATVIDPHYRSSWSSFASKLGLLMRFKRALGKECANENFVTPSDVERGEVVLYRKIQLDAFPEEVRALRTKKMVNGASNILKFSPFMEDEGIIRMSSRSQAAKMSYASRNPVILPNHHELVGLLIEHHHIRNKHMRDETIIADVRERVWIINIRTALKHVKSRCALCKLRKAKPTIPMMGQLPEARLDFGIKAFTHVGLDCFGPMNVKQGRSTIKRYGIIFTCLTYRGVHLEVLSDLSSDQVMIAIQSLFARRGQNQNFYSDNGTNFVGASSQMTRDVQVMEQRLGKAAALKFGVHWQFIPAYSPWMGGAWERLIRSVKESINFTLNGETPTEDVLRGALIAAEFEMNRRPLTHTPIDHEDDQPLTPNTVMFGENENYDLSNAIEGNGHSRLGRERVQHLCNKYMMRWIKEYLPEITRWSKWHKRTTPIKIDDIVIVVEPNEPRNAWKKGRVVKVNEGPDGIARSADVMLAYRTVKLKRAVGRLAVLDLQKSSASASDRLRNVGEQDNN